MNKNWLIALFYYEGTLAIGRLVPFWFIVALIFGQMASTWDSANRTAQEAIEAANAPPVQLTVEERDLKCRIRLMQRGYSKKTVDQMALQRLLDFCDLDSHMKYELID